MAADIGLSGAGVGLMTGVDVADVVSAADSGVTVWATVGLGLPTEAAEPAADEGCAAVGVPVDGLADRWPAVGTINIVVALPVAFGDAALVNAVATVTEAKAQALRDLGLAATGTPTDAVCLFAPTTGPAQEYGGPRSAYGAAIARATYAVLKTGGNRWISRGVAWSDRLGPSPRRTFSR